MTSIRRKSEEVFKVVTCLQILLFLNNKSIIHVCGRGWLQARDWFVDVIIV